MVEIESIEVEGVSPGSRGSTWVVVEWGEVGREELMGSFGGEGEEESVGFDG